jgi:predicted metal-dependent enzyme (double-stranded beta helix superfamily)
MVWAPGQGTPLHDHAGSWCVECVYQGRIRVTSYDLANETDGRAQFKETDVVEAGVGGAGALIPPFEYHTIENPYDETAVTVHVYQGELTWCHAFHPTDDAGWFRRERRELVYNT